ncbi:hypothetical protein FOVG_17973 [Fusarium oxysporum f. sp. pisi HDV247]|uniref:Uncharacterized protein n=1 Tax=Fusarium oxysporum f. sp. pisi HDV247 TaxID=1080344 RepID=W9ND67_FUSOX|nr:hypothetical protein FOVG_17973 [Fusarium oxysporum f. sp. pisi HDV247]
MASESFQAIELRERAMNVQLRLGPKFITKQSAAGNDVYGKPGYYGILANGNKAREIEDSTLAMTLRRVCNVCIVCTYK